MANTNYITSIVKIVEVPKQKLLQGKILRSHCRAALPQNKNNKLVDLVIWGDLSTRILPYCTKNDYILIEGFLTLSTKTESRLKKFKITVFKAYPIFLTSNRFRPSTPDREY